MRCESDYEFSMLRLVAPLSIAFGNVPPLFLILRRNTFALIISSVITRTRFLSLVHSTLEDHLYSWTSHGHCARTQRPPHAAFPPRGRDTRRLRGPVSTKRWHTGKTWQNHLSDKVMSMEWAWNDWCLLTIAKFMQRRDCIEVIILRFKLPLTWYIER
jgi:hypothetical protein